jgi:hypothetical protein
MMFLSLHFSDLLPVFLYPSRLFFPTQAHVLGVQIRPRHLEMTPPKTSQRISGSARARKPICFIKHIGYLRQGGTTKWYWNTRRESKLEKGRCAIAGVAGEKDVSSVEEGVYFVHGMWRRRVRDDYDRASVGVPGQVQGTST